MMFIVRPIESAGLRFSIGEWLERSESRWRGAAKSEVDVSSLVVPLVVSDGVEDEESWGRGGRARWGSRGDGGGRRSKGIAVFKWLGAEVAKMRWCANYRYIRGTDGACRCR